MENRICRQVVGVGVFGALVLWAASGQGQQPHEQPAHSAGADHITINADEVVWKDGPDSLPPGAKAAVLTGDPKGTGQFTMRLKMPAGYRIPAHTHPAIEHVTVISGTLHMGIGEKLDTSKGMVLSAGGFGVMNTGTKHYAWTEEETVVQVHGLAPWGITYLDPASDPRTKK